MKAVVAPLVHGVDGSRCEWQLQRSLSDHGMSERTATRLYLEVPLAAGAALALGADAAHRLKTVLRLGPGDPVGVFNADHGEWLARLAAADRRGVSLVVECRLRPPPERENGLWLLFAPLKRARIDWLVEKASELGASDLLPVLTQHTQSERLNLDRLRAHAVAAAEQSERLSVPRLHDPQPLAAVLDGWPAARSLLVCDETGGGEPIAAAAARLGQGPLALLIGPEGGFADAELDSLSEFSFVSRVGLGPRVLRADTAALAALAVLQAVAGDWRSAHLR
jgi:16S rRNA (uracil1498-N3)-methyltransferase